MNTNTAGPRLQIRGRSRPFRSLLVATAASLILTGFIVPRADAVLVTYFNFEDAPAPPSSTVDTVADTIAAGNPGGGTQASTLTITYTAGEFSTVAGLTINRSPGDSDTASPQKALSLGNNGNNNGGSISFSVNTQFLAGLSLSFAYKTDDQSFTTVTLAYSINGGAFTNNVAQPTVTLAGSSTATATFSTIDSAVNGTGVAKTVVFRLTFTGGTADDATIIDNIQLNAKVPEPATVWGGLLGVCGLCWHQRRRLTRFLDLRPAYIKGA